MARPAYQLIGSRGTGSQIAELAFAAGGLPLEVRYLEWTSAGLFDKSLRDKNPLGQVPTMVLPDGSVLTESAAIVFLANDLAPKAGLVPQSSLDLRARFFHWLMILNAALYPTFTYGDAPEKWLEGHTEAGSALRRSTDNSRIELWKRFEAEAKAPWFLGDTFSAIDLYIAVMHEWRPGTAWFKTHAPKLTAIRERVASDTKFGPVFEKNRI